MVKFDKASTTDNQSIIGRLARFGFPSLAAVVSIWIWVPGSLRIGYHHQPKCSVDHLSQPITQRILDPFRDPHGEYEVFNQINGELSLKLRDLMQTPFFSHYKMNLHKQCPWRETNGLCTQRDCAVEILDEAQMLNEWARKLGAIDYSSDVPSRQKYGLPGENQWISAENCQESVYVNLIQNPERFTGYNGESANLIWQLIYAESSFQANQKHSLTTTLTYSPLTQFKCEEPDASQNRHIFYKLISGIHASISIHICNEFYDARTSKWRRDMQCYHDRVGKFPDRIENIYFVYGILLDAIGKGSTYFDIDDALIIDKQAVSDAKSLAMKAHAMTSSELPISDSTTLLDELLIDVAHEKLKGSLHNVLRIIDCIPCERCRLWGEIQVSGLVTALDILFSYESKLTSFAQHLQRYEVVALFNTFNRFTESIEAVQYFQSNRMEFPN